MPRTRAGRRRGDILYIQNNRFDPLPQTKPSETKDQGHSSRKFGNGLEVCKTDAGPVTKRYGSSRLPLVYKLPHANSRHLVPLATVEKKNSA